MNQRHNDRIKVAECYDEVCGIHEDGRPGGGCRPRCRRAAVARTRRSRSAADRFSAEGFASRLPVVRNIHGRAAALGGQLGTDAGDRELQRPVEVDGGAPSRTASTNCSRAKWSRDG